MNMFVVIKVQTYIYIYTDKCFIISYNYLVKQCISLTLIGIRLYKTPLCLLGKIYNKYYCVVL